MDNFVLGDVADVGEPAFDGLATHRYPTGAGDGHAGERTDQGRLAGPALADDCDELAWLDAESAPVQDRLLLDGDHEVLGVETQRAPVVALKERGSVEDEP